MKIVYTYTESHKPLLNELFLPTLDAVGEGLEHVPFQMGHQGGGYCSPLWTKAVVERFDWYSEVMKSSMGERVLFSDVDISFFKPMKSVLNKHLDGLDIIFQREWETGITVNTGFIYAECNERVLGFFRKIREEAGKRKHTDQITLNNMIREEVEFGVKRGILPMEFTSDHFIKKVVIGDAIMYHSIGDPLRPKTRLPYIEAKLEQHAQVRRLRELA